jgi:aminoglycoside phosphotransferase (APT) family kinase protein
VLRRAVGQGLAGATRLSGGASQETWAVDAEGGGDGARLILRRRPGGATAGPQMAVPLETEAQLLALVAAAGVPVPAVRAVLAPGDGLGSGYLMERLEGETIPRRILRDDAFAAVRPQLAAQCGAILARIHAVSRESLPPLAAAPAEAQWRQYRDLYDRFDWPHPVFELAFRWIEERLPEMERSQGPETLVHGDFRHGNLLVDPAGVRGVLDWELAHVGDPMEDLGWICVNSWRFGNIDLPVGGFGAREELFAAYEAAGGRRVDPERVRFWEVVGSLKWGIMCMMMLDVFERGVDRSVERAAIGRRASEAEIDLLDLLAPED